MIIQVLKLGGGGDNDNGDDDDSTTIDVILIAIVLMIFKTIAIKFFSGKVACPESNIFSVCI